MSKTYEVLYLHGADITLNGAADEPVWRRARSETDFAFPWEDRPAPRTEFRAFFDHQWLCFAFRVEDDDVVLAEDYREKQDVMVEDRVELFFALDESLADYFCLEIDPLGRVLDYRASYYRRFDFSWSFPGVETAGQLLETGYSVEGRIARRSLEASGLPPLGAGRPIKFGVYRAEFRHGAGPQPIEGWISWVDPQTVEPDFHVPQSFGWLVAGQASR